MWYIYYSNLDTSTRFIVKGCDFHALLYLIFYVLGILYCEFLSIYIDNPRLDVFIVENTLFYLYNMDFRALKWKWFKYVVILLINKKCLFNKSLHSLDFFFHVEVTIGPIIINTNDKIV